MGKKILSCYSFINPITTVNLSRTRSNKITISRYLYLGFNLDTITVTTSYYFQTPCWPSLEPATLLLCWCCMNSISIWWQSIKHQHSSQCTYHNTALVYWHQKPQVLTASNLGNHHCILSIVHFVNPHCCCSVDQDWSSVL